MHDDLVKRLRICPDYNEGCVNCPHKHDLGCRTTTMHEAADAIEELDFACNRYEKDYKDLCAYLPKWIPVTDALPDDGQWVLVWGHGQCIPIMMFRESGAWIDDQFEFYTTITHWMPLPEPPKEE